MGLAGDLIYIVLFALLGAMVARAAKQPLILGYVLAGLVVGPNTPGITISEAHNIEMLAEIGVGLLLFTLGLEFSLTELRHVAKIALLGTPIQLLLTGIVGYGLARAVGLGHVEGIWFGCAVSLSSTMVVLKTLSARGLESSRAGRVMLGILIAQDLALIPMLLVLPQLGSGKPNFLVIAGGLLRALILLVVMYIAGVKLFPRLFAGIAKSGSRELLFLSFLAIALGVGLLTHDLGMSFAFGAFLAGIVLSETEFNHQALADLSSLRDLFGMIFFVSVGMLFDPAFFVDNIWVVSGAVAGLVVSKAIITGLVVRCLGYTGAKPFVVGIGIAQIGELAFLIANTGHRAGQIGADAFSMIISIAVASMMLTPALMALAPKLYQLLVPRGSGPAVSAEQVEIPEGPHVVVIGGGTVGDYLSKVLSDLEVPFVIVESDHERARALKEMHENVIFGDATQAVILQAARIENASLVVVAATALKDLPTMVREISSLNPDVPIVTRVNEVSEVPLVKALGVKEVVQPQLEASLELVRQSLLALGHADTTIMGVLGDLRLRSYDVSERDLLGQRHIGALGVSRMLDFNWYEIGTGSRIAGKSLEALRLRELYDVSIVGVVRGKEFIAVPGGSFHIEANDILAVIGTHSQLNVFRTSEGLV